MMNAVLTVNTIQLHKIRPQVLGYLEADIQELEQLLTEKYQEHLNQDLTTSKLTYRKLSHPNCRPGWFTDREVKYLVEMWLTNNR